MGVEPGRDQHQLRGERPRQRHRDVVDERAEDVVARPGRDRQVDRVAGALARADVARPDRCPGYSGDWWIETNRTRGSAWKMSLVPLPWWTSQSRIITRSSPCASSAWRAATAMLLNRQKPIARAGSAWWPGGRWALKPIGAAPSSSRSTSSTAPPAACSAASNDPSLIDRVGVELAAAAPPTRARSSRCRPRGAPRRASPRRSRREHPLVARASRAARARSRSRRSAPAARGAARCRGASDEGCSRRTGAAAIGEYRTYRCTQRETQVTVVGAGAAGLYTALCAARAGRARDARLGDAAGRVLELLGPGRPGRGAGRTTTARSAISPTRSPPAAARSASRPRASCARRRRRRSQDLAALGVHFDTDRHGQLALGLEGGHSVRRIVHAGGAATGRRVIRQLSALVAAGRADRGARAPAGDPDPDRRRARAGGRARRRQR